MTTTVTGPLSTEVDPLLLRQTYGCFPTGVTAVCALADDGSPVGMAVSSFTSVSLDPPLVAVCMAASSSTWPQLRERPRLGVSVLGVDHEVACRQLSARTGDRFAGLTLESTADGAVFVAGSAAWLDCVLENEMVAGDHVVVLLRIAAFGADPSVAPLVFHGSRFRGLSD